MKEAQRFLRYVIPGLVFIIEVSLYLLISARKEFVGLRKELWLREYSLAFPFSVFLTSGGLGFLLGGFHHVLYWRKWLKWKWLLPVVDHCELLNIAMSKNWLKLISYKYKREYKYSEEEEIKTIEDKLEAMCIVHAFWHERVESSKKIKEANSRVESLTDIMHGLGTACIGSFFAILVWLFIYFEFFEKCNPPFYCSIYFIIAFVISIIMFWVHICNYRNIVTNVQRVVNIIIADVLKENYSKNRTAIEINVNLGDFKKNKF